MLTFSRNERNLSGSQCTRNVSKRFSTTVFHFLQSKKKSCAPNPENQQSEEQVVINLSSECDGAGGKFLDSLATASLEKNISGTNSENSDKNYQIRPLEKDVSSEKYFNREEYSHSVIP